MSWTSVVCSLAQASAPRVAGRRRATPSGRARGVELLKRVALACVLLAAATPSAASVYWALLNPEGTSTDAPTFVTYATFEDMAFNRNPIAGYSDVRTDDFFNQRNIVGTGYDGTRYWALLNREGTSRDFPVFVTYATFEDMAFNRHPIAGYSDVRPDDFFNQRDVVGSGYDGVRYWTLLNHERLLTDAPTYVTYATFEDMVFNRNPLAGYSDVRTTDFFNQRDTVDSGYDGVRYWALLNHEGTSTDDPTYVTYATFEDMAFNRNPLAGYSDVRTDDFFNQKHTVGGGNDVFPSRSMGPPGSAAPEPATWLTVVLGLGLVGGVHRRRWKGRTLQAIEG